MSIKEILCAIFANLGIKNKPEIKFFIELFELLFSIQGRINFENLSRFSSYARVRERTAKNGVIKLHGLLARTVEQKISC